MLRRLALNAAALEAVNAYLDHPAPRAWVVLLAEGAKSRDWERNPVWQRLQRQEEALGFFRRRRRSFTNGLTWEAAGLGKTLTLAAAQRLVEVVGDNLAELIQELEKPALYAGAEKSLTPNLVNQLATHSRTHNIFAPVEALGEPGVQAPERPGPASGPGRGAAQDPGDAGPAIAPAALLQEGGPAAAAYQRHVNVQPNALKKLAQQATRFSEAALRSHLSLLNQIDWQLKTSGGPPLCCGWSGPC